VQHRCCYCHIHRQQVRSSTRRSSSCATLALRRASLSSKLLPGGRYRSHRRRRRRRRRRYHSAAAAAAAAVVTTVVILSQFCVVARNKSTHTHTAGMQSWIRDLIDLKTQISVLQNCMHAASQQPCTASQPLQGCRQCEPWTAAAAPIDPATAWPNGLLRQRAGYLRLLSYCRTRSAGQAAARSIGAAAAENTHLCTYLMVVFIHNCSRILAVMICRGPRRPAPAAAAAAAPTRCWAAARTAAAMGFLPAQQRCVL
jgi:hypothetical protein